MNLFRRNISEIAKSRQLIWYGYLLLLIHGFTISFWFPFDFSFGPIPWPGLSGIVELSKWVHGHWTIVLSIYGSIVMTGFFFLVKKLYSQFYFIFILLCLVKLFIQLTDFRLMGNYHYMPYLISLIYLFFPKKEDLIRIFIVLFYFSAGLIKFNTDWLSGTAIPQIQYFNGFVLQLGLAYVIILELFIVFFLLSRKSILFYFAFVQLVLFHAFSFQIVGYFYPSIMACLLTGFIIFKSPVDWRLSKSSLAAILLFLMVQFYTIVFHPNSAIDGVGRILSLNMFDARTQCETHFYVKKRQVTLEHSPQFSQFGIRIQCDPTLVVSELRDLCEQFKNDVDFFDIDFYHQTRRMSEAGIVSTIQFSNVCTKPVHINLLGIVSND